MADSEDKKSICPLCGSDQYVEADLDEEIKDAFLESMLGCVPFCRTYDVMDGKLSLSIQASDEDCNRKKSRLYIKMAEVSEVCPDFKAYVPLIESYMDVDSQVIAVTINGKEFKRTPCSGIVEASNLEWVNANSSIDFNALADRVLKVFESNMFDGTKVPIAILKGAVVKHNVLLGRLIKECLDENFLAGTGR